MIYFKYIISVILVISLSGEVYYPILKMGTLTLREVKSLPKSSWIWTFDCRLPTSQETPGCSVGGTPWPHWPLLCQGDISCGRSAYGPPPCPQRGWGLQASLGARRLAEAREGSPVLVGSEFLDLLSTTPGPLGDAFWGTPFSLVTCLCFVGLGGPGKERPWCPQPLECSDMPL